MADFTAVVDIIYSVKDRKLLDDFMLGITTSKEREEFAQRVEIVKRLVAGEPQLKIAKELGVGIATVTRGSKELSQGRFKVLRSGHE